MRKLVLGTAIAFGFLVGAPTTATSEVTDPKVMFNFDSGATPITIHGWPGFSWTDGTTGLKVNVYREGGAVLKIINVSINVPTFGKGALSPLADTQGGQINVEFDYSGLKAGYTDRRVQRIDWDMGDFVGSDDDLWTVSVVDLNGDAHDLGTPGVIYDADFSGKRFSLTHGHIDWYHPAAQWSFLGGSDDFPMSLLLDNLQVTLGAVSSDGGWTEFVSGGSDLPESVPGGDGGAVSVDGTNGDGGLANVVALLYDAIDAADLSNGVYSSLLAKLDSAVSDMDDLDWATAEKSLGKFIEKAEHWLEKEKLDESVAEDMIGLASAAIELLPDAEE